MISMFGSDSIDPFKIHVAEVETSTTTSAKDPMAVAELPAAEGDKHVVTEKVTEEWIRDINSEVI